MKRVSDTKNISREKECVPGLQEMARRKGQVLGNDRLLSVRASFFSV